MSEENNIQKINGNTLIFNGGNPLNDCPDNWDDAWRIQAKLNGFKDGLSKDVIHEETNDRKKEQPTWSFDCGFKLDFDGSLLSVSSRFYPPKTHYGSTWDGSVSIFLFGECISDAHFDCETLEILQKEVEEYIEEIKNKLKKQL